VKPHVNRFKSQSLALFFIVSLIPALVVAAVWYVNSLTYDGGQLVLDFRSFVLPVFFLGVIPAMVLSLAFAELLSRPVRRIHAAVLELARGNLGMHLDSGGNGEFREISAALEAVAAKLQAMLSQAAGEQAVIESERNKLRSVLNAMTDGVFALDSTGHIILFNKAASELTGRTIESVAGQLAEKVMPFRQDGELVMTRWLATQKGDAQHVGQWHNLELYRADGASLYVDVQAVKLPQDPNGINVLVTFHDLTARTQLEQMKVDFVALAAHELRTPLTELKGYLDILSSEAKGLNKDNRQFLARSVESAAQLTGLLNNLLGVARIEHGELNYQPEQINYLTFLQDLQAEMAERFKDQDRQLTLNLPAKLPTLAADPVGLREVLLNLINNAVTHTQRTAGTIAISVKQHQEEIETSITDNGSGIPADALPHLFQKFYRVDEMKSTTRGTGLGLYICRSIVEAHGGHIWAESVEGKGSTFTFRLPAAKVAPSAPGGDNTPKITRGAHGWIKEHSVH
jgi:PAS domain S-box-containing protein